VTTEPTTDTAWTAATPLEAGFTLDLDDRFETARAAGLLPNLHGMVAVRHGRIFFERYLDGIDTERARPLGVVRFGPDTLHDLRSVSKSIVGLLYGIAQARGHAPPPEASLLAQFPEYPDIAADPAKGALTVGHALTMTLGTSGTSLLSRIRTRGTARSPWITRRTAAATSSSGPQWDRPA